MTLGALAFGFAMGVGLAARIFHRRQARALAGFRGQFPGHARRVRAGICHRAAVDFGLRHQIEAAARGALGIAAGT